MVWTPSHKTHQESLSGGIPLEHWVVNTLADTLAGKGAEDSALEQEQIELALGNEKRAHNILRRLVFIAVSIVPTRAHRMLSQQGTLQRKWQAGGPRKACHSFWALAYFAP